MLDHSGNGAGVDTAAQEYPDRYVGSESVSDCREKSFADSKDHFLLGTNIYGSLWYRLLPLDYKFYHCTWGGDSWNENTWGTYLVFELKIPVFVL